MLTCVEWNKLSETEKRCVIKRPVQNNKIQNQVTAIISEVRKNGDDALLAYAKQFDGVSLSNLTISTASVDPSMISNDVLAALQTAIDTITRYHKAMLPKAQSVETAPGVLLRREYRPIERVGLYVPGGHKTPLISSLLMQAIPARIAGCPIRVLCTPPNDAGEVDLNLVVAARLCGIETIYLVGGAQAIAAMAYGTASVPKVDKLFGPGNGYVTEAKLQVAFDSDGAAIDLPAGPSEVMILADEYANPAFVAADLLAQAEHGIDSQVILICESMRMAKSVNEALQVQLIALKRRDFIMQSLQYGSVIICDDIKTQLSIVNTYAPEHLIINRLDAASRVDAVNAAGSIFVGPWAAETLGDYVTGSNHVLPTYGFARKFSGLGVSDFLTTFTVQSVSEEGVQQLGKAAEILANLEGLDAHANAVRIRLNAFSPPSPACGRRAGDEGNFVIRQALSHAPSPTSGRGERVVTNLARTEVMNLTPYSSARNESNQAGLHLDANENPFVSEFNRYPEPQPVRLRQKLCALYGVNEAQLLITRGSDEAIDLLMRVFCQANRDGILITPPTYGMYSVSANIQDAFIQSVPLSSQRFELDVDLIIKQWQPTVQLIFLCSPNNPTGNSLDTGAVLRLCETFREKALIVVDEAYIEFSSQQGLTRCLDKLPNLVILRTLSKAYGLAGARCGSVLAHPDIIALLGKIIAPYPIPTPVVQVVLDALSDANVEQTKARIQIIQTQREQLREFLQHHPSVKTVYPSDANFLLVAVDAPKRWMSVCREHGIVIRDRSNIPGLSDCIRISIGTPEENQRLQEVLAYVEA